METLAIISDLIGQAELAQNEQKQKSAQQVQNLIQSTRVKAIEQLGDVWTWLEPCVSEKVYVKNDGRDVNIEWSLLSSKVDQFELAPLEINACSNTYSDAVKINVWRKRGYSWESFSYRQLPEALYKAHERFAAFKQEITDEYTKDRTPSLEWWRNRNDEKALQAHRELVEALPDRRVEWDEMLNAWIKARDAQRARDEEESAAQARYDALREAYRAQYEAYLLARETALAHNAEVLAPIQSLLDIPFATWQLTYAIHARDDEGESIVETRTVWLAQEEPDPTTGEYILLDGRRVRYYNPVSTEVQIFKPSDELAGSYRKVLVHGHDLYVPANLDQQKVDPFIASGDFLPLPDEPAIPEGLDSYDADRIKRSFRPEPDYSCF